MIATAALAFASPASAVTFYAGAGKQDITPPLSGTAEGNAADAQFGPDYGSPACAAIPGGLS